MISHIAILVIISFSCLAAITTLAAINDALVPVRDSSAVQCTVCSKVLSTVGNGRIHVEDMHFPRAVECLICNDTCPSIKKFRNHISGTHKKVGEKNVVGKYGKFVKEPNVNTSPTKIVWG